MDIREIIKKARQQAKTSEELLLPDHFEEYLDLLEMKREAKKSDKEEIDLRLKKTLCSLKEAAERVCLIHGISPDKMVEFFSNPANLDPRIAGSLHEISNIEKPASSSAARLIKSNKKLKV